MRIEKYVICFSCMSINFYTNNNTFCEKYCRFGKTLIQSNHIKVFFSMRNITKLYVYEHMASFVIKITNIKWSSPQHPLPALQQTLPREDWALEPSLHPLYPPVIRSHGLIRQRRKNIVIIIIIIEYLRCCFY